MLARHLAGALPGLDPDGSAAWHAATDYGGPRHRRCAETENLVPSGMIIFISSVRHGLEEERDALPGLIEAVGHAPRRFEDWTARPVPPREACLQGVEGCDAYLLLLGERYGEPMPDTSLAPTEEEFTVARRRGIPVLVFRKAGVTMEPEQQRFADRVEAYAAGFFRDSFRDTADLLTKVAKALRQLGQRPAPLETRPLDGPLPADWLAARRQPLGFTATSMLELHLIPVPPARISATALEAAAESLVRLARASGHFAQAEGVQAGSDGTYVWAAGERAGLRLGRNGEVTVWLPLPRDSMGVILDRTRLEADIVGMLHVAADIDVGRTAEVALAAALDPLDMMVVEGDASELGRRNRVSLPGMPTNSPVRVDAEEAVAARSIAHGAADLARELALRLVHAFRQR